MKVIAALPGALKLALPLMAGIALAGAIAWGANHGGGGAEPAVQAPAATTTPAVEKTPGPPWDPARPDCPQGWRVYNDPDGYFSLCYPRGLLELPNAVPSAGVASAFTLSDPENANSRAPVNVFALHISRLAVSASQVGPMASPSICSSYTGGIPKPTSAQYLQISFAGRLFGGCQATGEIGRGPQTLGNDLQLLAPAAADGTDTNGFMKVTLTSIGPDLQGTTNRAFQILATLRLK